MNEELKVHVVVYTDPWTHCECETDCCGVDDKEVIGVAISEELAEDIISKEMCIRGKREDFDIKEFDLKSGCGVVIVE